MSIVRDATTRTVLWTIVHIEHGYCQPMRPLMNWVVVPRIDPGDSVAVVVETEVVP